ncbi:MAG: NB-ARC domain-containing protein [Caldilineaceae bacterium]
MTVNLTTATHNFSANWLTHGDVHKALNGWHNGGVADSGLEHLYLFQHARLTGADTVRAAHNRVLQQALEQLTQSNAEYAQILQLRFLDNLKAENVANQLNLASSTFYDRQKTAIEQLTGILCEMDHQERRARYELLERKLARQQKLSLVGLEDLVVSVSNQLNQSGIAWIVSIEGIGGIGKTTLAGEAVRHALWSDVSWENVAWVTVRPIDFPHRMPMGRV